MKNKCTKCKTVYDVKDETIMPDGRPFLAWKLEREFLSLQHFNEEDARRKIADTMRLLNIAQIESMQEPSTGDLVIRFRMIDQVNSFSKDDMKYIRD